jgi:hypothetical protein
MAPREIPLARLNRRAAFIAQVRWTRFIDFAVTLSGCCPRLRSPSRYVWYIRGGAACGLACKQSSWHSTLIFHLLSRRERSVTIFFFVADGNTIAIRDLHWPLWRTQLAAEFPGDPIMICSSTKCRVCQYENSCAWPG